MESSVAAPNESMNHFWVSTLVFPCPLDPNGLSKAKQHMAHVMVDRQRFHTVLDVTSFRVFEGRLAYGF